LRSPYRRPQTGLWPMNRPPRRRAPPQAAPPRSTSTTRTRATGTPSRRPQPATRPPSMRTRTRATLSTNSLTSGHPQPPPAPFTRKRKDGSPLVWEGRVKFTNPNPALCGQTVTPLDANAAYLSALQTAHLPIRQITHNPNGVHEKYGTWSWDNPDNYGKGID